MSLECQNVFFRKKFWHEVQANSDSGIPTLIGLCIATDASREFTIIGEILKPVSGQEYRFWGEWKDSKKNPGILDFHFYSFEIVSENSVDGMALYLERHVDELGSVRSRQIVEHFGPKDVLKILRENPFRVKEIKGIGTATAESISEHFEKGCGVDPAAYASVADILSEVKNNRRIISQILRDFGANAISVVKENPYILLDYSGIGWASVDLIACKKLKYDPNGIHRHRGAVLEVLKKYSDTGDTFVTGLDLECHASKEMKVNISKQAIKSLIEDGSIEETLIQNKTKFPTKCYSLRSLWEAEKEISFRLKLLTDSCNVAMPKIDTTGLEGEQIDACKFLENHPVSILCGPPGVGKTTTITKAIQTIYKHGIQIIVVAPTGKAAKRASEVLEQWIPASGIPVSTIHKSLEPAPWGSPIGVPEDHAKFGRSRDKFMFTRTEENPIEMEIGIIDEMSMVDTDLFLQWLRAVPVGCRLILSGDSNQLPSVGPGAILRDLIAGGIPTFTLTKPRRNSGRIVKACHAIKDGRVPSPSPEYNPEIGENWFHFEEETPLAIQKRILWLYDQTDRDKMKDIQIISPQNERPEFISCDDLNIVMSMKLNPKGLKSDLIPKYEKYRIGDKVVRTKNALVELMTLESADPEDDFIFDDYANFHWKGNNYHITKTPIVNGDIGQIVDISKVHGKAYVFVQFSDPDRLCCLRAGEANISLAYATTCHKAQGSGFPIIIMPTHNSFHWNDYTKAGTWHRETLYTELSRGISGVFTVGQFSAFAAAIARKTIDNRKTMLKSFIMKDFVNVS